MKKDRTTIAITFSFATDDLLVKDGKGDPYIACWDNGWANILSNKALGIKADSGHFNAPEDILPLLKELLRKQGIVMVGYNSRPRVLNPKRKKW